MAKLSGHIERVTFSSQENAFSVCKLKVKGQRDLVTIVGNMANPVPGECVEIEGKWGSHSKFGNQFQITKYKTLVPATAFGIQKYLGSGLIKGIGPVMAKRIVKAFGIKAMDIIENDIDKLSQVEGIGKKRVKMIQKAWDEQKEVRSVMLFLQSHGVSTAYAAKIYKVYGQDAINIVKENPYRLARDIFGIGFLTADSIAMNLGIQPDAPQRIQAGLEYVLLQLSDEGHVCFPYDELQSKIEQMLKVPEELVVSAINESKQSDRVVIETINESDVAESATRYVFLKKFHICEIGITSNLYRIQKSSKSIRKIDEHRALEWVKSEIKIEFAKEQELAVRKSLQEKVLIITGGPGTGKTTIINAILKIFQTAGAKIFLAAPTGRAAKRMSETTRAQAKTIHRLLDYSMSEGGFKKNDKNSLRCDVLIVDEASMIDTVLMHHLLKAVPSSCTLILVGDVDQLPSVGAGNVLNDLIKSKAFSVVILETIFRQAQKSLIVVNAHKINRGDFPIIANENKKSNFYFIQKEEPEDVLNTIVDMIQTRIPDRFGYDPFDDIQILTPMHRGIVGAGNLNKELQKVLNPGTISLKRGDREFRVSDKVMQIRNNYDKHTYNGDIGRVEDIDFVNQKVKIKFYSRIVEYDFTSMDEVVHAYAVSVHKSQGSEYPVVIIPVVTQHYILLQRNLIYTAVTRGKRLVVLVGTKKALAMAINTVKSSNRYTRLCNRFS